MPGVKYASSWHLHPDAASVNRGALSTSEGGASNVTGDDPAQMGGRRLIVGANRNFLDPMLGDLGTHWTMLFWWSSPSGSGGGGNRIVFCPENGSGQRTVNCLGVVPTAAPSNRLLRVRLGTTTLHDFPGGSGAGAPVPYRIEVVEHATEGIVRAWRAGELAYVGTDLNTSRAFAFDRVRFAGAAAAVNSSHYAHAILLDDEDPGPGMFLRYRGPNATIGAPDFVRSDVGEAHHDLVSDQPHDSDGTYLRSDDEGVGDLALFGFPGPGEVSRIFSLRPAIAARITGEDPARVGVSLHSGTADPVEEQLEVDQDEYVVASLPWVDEDPDTEEEWSAGGVGDVELEIEHLGPEE